MDKTAFELTCDILFKIFLTDNITASKGTNFSVLNIPQIVSLNKILVDNLLPSRSLTARP